MHAVEPKIPVDVEALTPAQAGSLLAVGLFLQALAEGWDGLAGGHPAPVDR